MAVISSIQDVLVVRIVYDGPPLAGKTTSLRTLATQLGSTLQTPAEVDGRTVYFDWLDYTGGTFDGRRIRCQIVSVPGQAVRSSRRRTLLESADAVVFVADTTRTAVKQGRSCLRGTRAVLSERAGPPVGVVLQANKRDHGDAVPLGELRAALDAPDETVAIVESVATDGSGIREAFVFAVRLALDRVRELMKHSQLETTQPSIDSAAELLHDFERREGSAQPSLPRADLPSGRVWPPVEGRLILHEATMSAPLLQRSPDGDWHSVAAKGWCIQSPAGAEFNDLSAARAAMLDWARSHASRAEVIGGRRCIALCDDGANGYRLWQCVSTVITLRERVEQALMRDAAALVETLVVAARALVRARAEWGSLPVRLDTVALTPHGPRYAFLMPYPSSAEAEHSSERASERASEDLPTFLGRELACAKVRLAAIQAELTTVLGQRARRHIRAGSKPDPAVSLIHLLQRSPRGVDSATGL